MKIDLYQAALNLSNFLEGNLQEQDRVTRLISIWPGLMTHITVYLNSLVDLLTFNRILVESLCRLYAGFMTLILTTYAD